MSVSGPAFAQVDAKSDTGTLQEIIVTAQRREENLQSVPISVTAFTGEMIERGNISSAADYLSLTPNASFSEDANWGSSGVNLSIRGVSDLKTGQNSVVNAIGIYLDGFSVVSLPTSTFNPKLGDMQSVEVLRGPQGTYFGRNSLGGALNLTTRVPGAELGGEVIGGAENFSTRGSQDNGTVIVNLPITSEFSTRGVFNYENSSGMVQNVNPNGVGTGHKDMSGRVTALWTPTDQTTVKMTLMRSDDNQAGDETIPSGVWNVDTVTGYVLGVSNLTQAVNECGVGFWPQNQSRVCRDGNEYTKDDTSLAILNVAQNLSSGVVLKWISGIAHETGARYYDGDGVGEFDNFNNFEQRNGTSYSTELRAEMTTPKYVWVVGALYANDRQELHNDVLAGTQTNAPIDGAVLLPFIPDDFCFSCTDRHFELSSASIFTDLTYHATSNLELIGGGRFTHDDVTTTLINEGVIFPNLSSTGVAEGKPSFTDFSPRIGTRYAVDDDLNFYGTISKGYKAGGTSVGFNANPSLVPLPAIIEQPFRAETLWNYEAGMKSEWLDHRLRVNASVFYLDWHDLQLEAYRFLVPGNLESKFALTTNINRARGEGAELEFTGLVTSRFTLSGALGYLDTKILQSPLVELSGGYKADLVGLPVPKSPPFTANFSADYRWSVGTGDLSTRAEFVHRDGQYSDIEALTWKQTRGTAPPDCAPACFLPATSNGFPFHTPSYNLVNLRATYDVDGVSTELYVDNLFDEIYYTGTAEDYGLAGIHLRPHPRILGIQVEYKFGGERRRP
jgi:iron complex outermembrane receptor protein